MTTSTRSGLGRRVKNHLGIRPCDLSVHPEAGVAFLGPLRHQRKRTTTPQGEVSGSSSLRWEPTAPGRARRSVVDLAVANQLTNLITLTYAELPADPERELRLFTRRLRRTLPSRCLKFVAVTEVEHGHRVHHHLLSTVDVTAEMVSASWPMGAVNVRTASSHDRVRRQAFYISKMFDRGAEPGRHRYRRSRNLLRPNPVVFEQLSATAAQSIIEEYVGDKHVSIRTVRRTGGTLLCLTWEPDMAGTEGG